MAALNSLFTQLAVQGGGAVFSFALVLVLAATLGPEGYGVYAWILSMGTIGGLLLQAGLPVTILKKYAPLDLNDEHQPLPVSDTFATFTGLAILALIAASLISLTGTEIGLFIWALPVAAAFASFKIGSSILLSGGRPIRAHLTEHIVRVLIFFIFILLGHFLEIKEPLFYIFCYSVAALAAPVPFLTRMLFGALKNPWRRPQMVRRAGAHFQAMLSRSVADSLPVFISGFFLESSQLAYLALAIQLSRPIIFGQNAALYYYGAVINKAVKAGNLSAVRRLYRNSVMFSNATAWPLSIVLFFGMYGAMTLLPSGWADFEVTPEFLAVFGGILAFRVAYTLTGPSQLVAILLGAEKFVRNVNLLFLAGLTAGLTGAAQLVGTQGVVMIMIVHAITLNSLVALNLLRKAYGNA